MLIHDLESHYTYLRVSQEVDLDVAPVWLLLPSDNGNLVQKLSLIMEKETPKPWGARDVTAVEFRNRFGMYIGIFLSGMQGTHEPRHPVSEQIPKREARTAARPSAT
jgi:hypothetical protein